MTYPVTLSPSGDPAVIGTLLGYYVVNLVEKGLEWLIGEHRLTDLTDYKRNQNGVTFTFSNPDTAMLFKLAMQA